jgi:hypothetical protein
MGWVAVVACAAALTSCSWHRLEDSGVASTTTISDEMRSVPTVPGPGSAGDAAAAALAPDAELGAPPTTALIGDPKPNVDSQVMQPPLPESPVVDGCTRLSEVAAVDAVAAGAGSLAMAEPIGEAACRFSAGAVVAEVYYLSESTVSSEWYRRDGIDPVGEIGGDAVGIASFLTPGAVSGDGFTIAMISRREGAVIAVRGAAANRELAVQLALLVGATT